MEGSYQEICKDIKFGVCIPFLVLACSLHSVKRNRCVYMHVFFILNILCVCTSRKIVILFHMHGTCTHICVCVCVPINLGVCGGFSLTL